MIHADGVVELQPSGISKPTRVWCGSTSFRIGFYQASFRPSSPSCLPACVGTTTSTHRYSCTVLYHSLHDSAHVGVSAGTHVTIQLISADAQAHPISPSFNIFYKKTSSMFGSEITTLSSAILGPDLSVKQTTSLASQYFEMEIKMLKVTLCCIM